MRRSGGDSVCFLELFSEVEDDGIDEALLLVLGICKDAKEDSRPTTKNVSKTNVFRQRGLLERTLNENISQYCGAALSLKKLSYMDSLGVSRNCQLSLIRLNSAFEKMWWMMQAISIRFKSRCS
jgi:hypothetical protein